MSRLKRLIAEIHRRSLWQVLGIYLLGGWLVLQFVDTLAGALNLPAWASPLALFLLVIGLPIVLATAFLQGARSMEKGGEAAASPETPDPAAGNPQRLFTWRNALVGGVLAFAGWGLVSAAWYLWTDRATHVDSIATTAADSRSIAVIPFANRSARPEDEFFVEGIHDDILAQLSKIDALTVISRTSVMRYQDTNKSIPEIAGELGVATVLEGGVQRSGERVRINLQLIDAGADRPLWGATYDEELTAQNVFAIQSDVAAQVASALRATLAPELVERLERPSTESLEAYDLFVRGRFVMNSSRGPTRAGLDEAADLFRGAIAADSAFAPAYTWLATTDLSRWNLALISADVALPEARKSVERALALDPEAGGAHGALGAVLHAELNFEEAEAAYRRALALDPGNPTTWIGYAQLMTDLSRFDETVRAARRAVQLDPLSSATRMNLAAQLLFVRDYEGSIDAARGLLELEPESAFGYYWVGVASTLLGRDDEAIAALRSALDVAPDDRFVKAGLAWVLARAGRRDEALAALHEVEASGPILKEYAIVHGALGELGRAFEYLERALEEDPGSLRYIRNDPSADPLKEDPRFARLLRRLGLE